MQTLLSKIKEQLPNNIDVAFNENVVYGRNEIGTRHTLVLITKKGEPVRELLYIHDELRLNTTGLTEQELIKLL